VIARNENELPISRFDYELPSELIAQEPAEPRDSARMLVIERSSGALTDAMFTDLPELLDSNDVLVMNDTRVIPARLFALRNTGGKIEFLFLRCIRPDEWLVLARPGRRLRTGERLQVVNAVGLPTPNFVNVIQREASGSFVVSLESTDDVLERFGQTPLPPYVQNPIPDPERYQTVFSRVRGSAAAPTAGLHFTEQLIDRCIARGASVLTLTLHVGVDTFQPIKEHNARDHQMHSEWYDVPETTVRELRLARLAGKRIIAVGTTVARTLETIAADLDCDGGRQGDTNIYITPPYRFKLVNGMVTNFHLPRTTLLLMVSALAGEDLILRAYRHAIQERYRFYSFGDATFIV
jgi:S-adenosylmethionine:tRNA ribosyltransferase-isomerase